MISELLRELIAAHRLARDPRFEAVLAQCGMPVDRGPVWGLATVTIDERFYEPQPLDSGRLAIVAPVFEDEALIDLTATPLGTLEVRTRRGIGQIMGAEAIDLAREFDRPLRVFANGWSWLRNDRAGIVILDWSVVRHRLHDLPGLLCENTTVARAVSQAFERPLVIPPIYVAKRKEQRHVA